MIPCLAGDCRVPAEVSVDGWLFLGPLNYCRPHAERFMAELRAMGWTFPFILGEPREPVEVDLRHGIVMVGVA